MPRPSEDSDASQRGEEEMSEEDLQALQEELQRAAEEAQQLLGEHTHVVAAMQNIGAHNLRDLNYKLDCDVLVCG